MNHRNLRIKSSVIRCSREYASLNYFTKALFQFSGESSGYSPASTKSVEEFTASEITGSHTKTSA